MLLCKNLSIRSFNSLNGLKLNQTSFNLMSTMPSQVETSIMKSKKRHNHASNKKENTKVIHNIFDAVDLVKNKAWAKFKKQKESIDISVQLGVDPRKPNQMIRGQAALPHGNGKSMRIAVFAEGDAAQQALDAGADKVGSETFIEECLDGEIDFTRAIATPDMMPELKKRLGKILGPKKLMPNEKLGTVTTNITKAVKDAKGGSVTFKVDKEGIIRASIGRINFEKDSILENIKSMMISIVNQKPEGLKGNYLVAVHLGSTMGPAIKVDLQSVDPSKAKFMRDPNEL